MSMISKLIVFASALLAMLLGSASAETPMRGAPVTLVNCGSYENYTDSNSLYEWESDKVHEYYSSSGTLGLSIISPGSVNDFSGTSNGLLYLTYRTFKRHKDRPYLYVIPVPVDGTFIVELHFAETEFSSVKARVMTIVIQGIVVHENVDIIAMVGPYSALTLESVVTVNGAPIIIEFIPVKQSVIVSAIGIYHYDVPALGSTAPSYFPSMTATSFPSLIPSIQVTVLSATPGALPSLSASSAPSPAPSSSPSMPPIQPIILTPSNDSISPSLTPTSGETDTTQLQPIALINCGGGKLTDDLGHVWEADGANKYFLSNGHKGTVFLTATDIEGTSNDALFQSAREWSRTKNPPYSYEIPVPLNDSAYIVRLFFAEINPMRSSVGRRVFNILVEGEMIESQYDISKAAGGLYKAVSVSTTVIVNDGTLSIELGQVVFNPILSGIAVYHINVPQEIGPSFAPSMTRLSSYPTMAPTYLPTNSSAYPSVSASSNPTVSFSPSSLPSGHPTPLPSISTGSSFRPVLINAGGGQYMDTKGRTFINDDFYSNGETFSLTESIQGTADDTLYQTQRYGLSFSYDILLPEGNFEIILHFCLLDSVGNTTNIFNIDMEDTPTFARVDIRDLVGVRYAMTLETVLVVADGSLLISLTAETGNALISAIEINLVGPHLAHAVAAGPYTGVDIDNDGYGLVFVDGQSSHTHALGSRLIRWEWYEATSLVASGEVASLNLPVGEHFITHRVWDDDGNESAETTLVNILPHGHPVIESLTPSSGNIVGGNQCTIYGYGFTYSAEETIVQFGSIALTGDAISIVNDNTIIVVSVPSQSIGIPVSVTVSTPIGAPSNGATYTYVNLVPISWLRGNLFDIYGPTVLAFDHLGKLYIGTVDGKIAKLTLNEQLNGVIESVISSVVAESDPHCTSQTCRTILGMTFDPMDTGNPNPPVYVSHSQIFHGESKSSSGRAVNGKVSIVSGANLDAITDLITGLPVSDHDHAINGIDFDDHGDLYILVGGNTNGGVPGALSASKLLKENVLSSTMLVAHVSSPSFDGILTYDADIDGNLVGGSGSVEIFASGLRSPFDFVFHSNGKIYATDNGPNLTYGAMSSSCTGSIPDIQEPDKLLLVVQGAYYGHANRKRGATDPRQCKWRSAYEESDSDYTAPIAIIPSSSNGIVEFQSMAFGGQLRGNVIFAKYRGEIFRTILTPDGTAVMPETNPPVVLHPDTGLDLTQGPNGALVFVNYRAGKVRFLAPNEPASEILVIKSVYPHRGPQAGGNVLTLYGENFVSLGNSVVVSVGSNACAPVVLVTQSKVSCILPGGTGNADIFVTNGNAEATYEKGYRYITGLPA